MISVFDCLLGQLLVLVKHCKKNFACLPEANSHPLRGRTLGYAKEEKLVLAPAPFYVEAKPKKLFLLRCFQLSQLLFKLLSICGVEEMVILLPLRFPAPSTESLDYLCRCPARCAALRSRGSRIHRWLQGQSGLPGL